MLLFFFFVCFFTRKIVEAKKFLSKSYRAKRNKSKLFLLHRSEQE